MKSGICVPRFIAIFGLCYFVLAVFVMSFFYIQSDILSTVESETELIHNVMPPRELLDILPQHSRSQIYVNIIGNMKIAQYLWHDILGAKKTLLHAVENFVFRLIPDAHSASDFTRFPDVVLLVGNGRSNSNILKLQDILDNIWTVSTNKTDVPEMLDLFSLFKNPFIRPVKGLTKLGLLMIGHEYCQNHWLKEYLSSNSGILSFVFTTYQAVEAKDDSNEVYQWPLGVASYRYFPPIFLIDLDLSLRRKYFVNFIGTVYKNSSRVSVVREMQNIPQGDDGIPFFLSPRHKWESEETLESAETYQLTLKDSDFTICPVGLNEETYRVYEAISMASIPIIEDCPPVFKSPEHYNLVNHCYLHSSLSGSVVQMSSKTFHPSLETSAAENGDWKFDRFLDEEGSYYFDPIRGRISAAVSETNSTNGRLYSTRTHDFLKKHKAPVLFVEHIDAQLIKTLRKNLNKEDIIVWRNILVSWYGDFRRRIRESFLDVIKGVML